MKSARNTDVSRIMVDFEVEKMKILLLTVIEVTVTFCFIMLIGIMLPPLLLIMICFQLFFKLARFAAEKTRHWRMN